MEEPTMSQFASEKDYWQARAELAEQQRDEYKEAARTWENEAERRSRRYEMCAVQRDELLLTLEEIADWVDMYTSQGHLVSTVARRAIAKARGKHG